MVDPNFSRIFQHGKKAEKHALETLLQLQKVTCSFYSKTIPIYTKP